MALRDQPYLPLYVQDFMSDEKLRQCGAESVGVYIFLMCIMHKSEEYGVIALNHKYFASDLLDVLLDGFSQMLSKLMPFEVEIIGRSLHELVAEKVLYLDGNRLIQGRMLRDGELSQKRATAGLAGGKAKSETNKEKQKASKAASKKLANTEIENEYLNKGGTGGKRKTFIKPTIEEVAAFCTERGKGVNPQKWFDHYESNGWMVGKTKMVDWKAAVRKWEPDEQLVPQIKYKKLG